MKSYIKFLVKNLRKTVLHGFYHKHTEIEQFDRPMKTMRRRAAQRIEISSSLTTVLVLLQTATKEVTICLILFRVCRIKKGN